MIGKVLHSRYEIIEKIGEGGMGLVYKAKDHLLNRFVAIKILKPELMEDEDFIKRFKKESLSSASLSHPNIVNIYDVGFEDGIYYIVMEYVKGKTLKDIIRERAPLPYYEVINISRQVCLALDHAHSNNIIHRDIKPQNILMTQDGIVKVGDFGIARASNSATLTNTGSIIGSVYYISPEQARGGYTDEKTDIYSLGTVMYELATGRVPFMADSPVVVALKHIQEQVTRPSEINPDIPSALEDIILKCLEKSPAMRYQSASAVIKDLDRASSNPNMQMQSKHDSLNDITRVMPAVKEEYLNDKNDDDNDNDIDDDNKEKFDSGKHRTKKRINKGWAAAIIILLTIITASVLFIFTAKSKIQNKDIPVPDVMGKDENTAMQTIKNANLGMEVIGRDYDEKPEGTVIFENPEAGTPVKAGYTVKVRVSKGEEKVSVPPVVGLTQADAIAQIEGAGLAAGNIVPINSNDVDKGKIVSQKPDANSEVVKGTVVDLYVSSGPEIKLVPVPDLSGYTLDNAEKVLKENKLSVGNVTKETDLSKPNGIVIKQSARDVSVPEGSKIDITINQIPVSS
ncbi:MAG: Stk1 family PASTA domain-containing Ser/Thr kinase [Clostridiales bacterium]|nr:Stk1 family PASTA domain-containing Ser/Thr kinase [Clostridiales bacterium]